MKKIDIKKELEEKEFKELIQICEKKFKQKQGLSKIAKECETKTKEITPAKEACLLLVKEEEKEFEILTRSQSIPFDIKKESILTECYTTKQPLLVNDVTRSFLYHEDIDNFLHLELKDLLLIPIVDDSPEKKVLAIIWSAITQGSWNQYTQKDLEYMIRFSMFIKHFLQEKEFIPQEKHESAGFHDCMEAYDKLSAQIRREQEYFSSIIHDVRTPMNAVMGFLELLKLKELDSEKKEYLETALKSGETMVALINDALDISKIASGKMSIEKVPFSPLEELSDVAKLFHNTAKKKNISFVTYYDPQVPQQILSDQHRLKQIMNNLLSNAIKFTPENGKIVLSLQYDKERDGLTISIQDTGIGIAEEMQKNIFTPYTQEKNSTSREYGGTGLGLSISQQLSILLGGKLQLESTQGKGSRFYVTIPCNTPEGTPPSLDKEQLKDLSIKLYIPSPHNSAISSIAKYLNYFHTSVEELKNQEMLQDMVDTAFDILIIFKDDAILLDTQVQNILDHGKSAIIIGDTFLTDGCHFDGNVKRLNTPILPQDLVNTIRHLISPSDTTEEEHHFSDKLKKLKNKHILVVDDNTINLKFMKEVLKTMQMETFLAQSGNEGIDTFNTEKVDLIFMDENMPGLQGDETIAKIRKIEKEKGNRRVTIIGLTGDADNKTKEKLLNAGADEVLTKPVQLQEIIRVTTSYL
jgi:signal transduction histidine kinase/ActR/RegA family two-component response regulator